MTSITNRAKDISDRIWRNYESDMWGATRRIGNDLNMLVVNQTYQIMRTNIKPGNISVINQLKKEFAY
jgi:hypothetical protein